MDEGTNVLTVVGAARTAHQGGPLVVTGPATPGPLAAAPPSGETGRMLVGRDAQLRLVEALVAAARVGRSGVLVVSGEAGIGKSALLEHASQVAGDVRLLRVTGSEAEQDVPFGGLSQLLRPTAADLDRLPPPQAQALGVALALRDGPAADRFAVGAAVLSLLTHYGEHRPLGVVVDDAHLLDAPSAEALVFACRRVLADSVFVLVAVRSGEPSPFTAANLPGMVLEGLDEDAVAALVRRHGEHAGPGQVSTLHRLTGGNPLAVLELAGDPTRLPSPAPGAALPVPAVLTHWFGRRARDLGEQARTVLLLTAVAGGDRSVVTRAATALGLDPVVLTEAERVGLVTIGPDRVDFSHPLVRASVLALAEPDERRRLHTAVADAVPAHDLDRRAWHRSEATFGFDDAVADLMAAVARRAGDRGAHAVSAAAHERSALLSSDDHDRARRLLAAAEAAWRGGDGHRAVRTVTTALALDVSPSARAGGLQLAGEVAAMTGSLAEANRLFLAAADQVSDHDPARAVRLWAEAVHACFLHGDAVAAGAVAASIQAQLRRPGVLSDPAATAVGTLAVGMAAVLAGRPGTDHVVRAVEQLHELTDDPDLVRPYWLMQAVLWSRQAGSARALVDRVIEQSRARSAVGTLPLLLFGIARDGATTHHWAAAEADYDEAITLARELGHITELTMSLAGLAWLEARTGQAESCELHADETLRLCTDHEVGLARSWAEYALGELALVQGDVVTAVARLGDLERRHIALGMRDPDLSPAPDLVEALLRQGEVETAREVAASHRAAAEAKGMPWALARAARVEGLLADADCLDEPFERSLALHARTPDQFETARTQLTYGARLRRSRRRADARPVLRAALDTFERLGAGPWAATAAVELVATGESVHRRDAADRERLTPRELNIALLLAEGRTTRQAAAALFLSPKTVEYHLRHIYTKLDIGTRGELTQRLGQADR